MGRDFITYAHDTVRISTADTGTGVYVGPRVPGNLNLGDNLLYWAHQHSLPDIPLRQVHSFPAILGSGTVRRRQLRGTVLGGGTLIGSSAFRRGLESTMALLRGRPVVNIGTGVDDPVMPSTGTPGDKSELRAWIPLLRSMPKVWVRGPLSQQLLREAGVEAEISGDPVLLFALDADLRHRPAVGRIGINLGFTGNQWQRNPAELVRTVVEYGHLMRKRGLQMVLISVWDRDDALTTSVANELGCPAILAPQLRTAAELRRLMKEIDVLVAQKLHAVVGAACVATPSIALEYRPKCRDFQESVGARRWTIRTSEVTSDGLAAMTGHLYDERETAIKTLAAHVTQRRTAIGVAALEAYEALNG
ncbi:Polysaccharide pyruvyl transferase [Micromonospora phaseoli]|uniref:Polysaccharide pyruvyl transferase n=1 Tax=Micromonospora phaseoli TaxID=1144548 RepID=A0A1H6SFW2_9ACTN|nr:polysaccharide pyruvyl transferase family protein [Micromonospora phaseoli]PZW03905.1 polysaccharide pyruvyl transferase [Micromonospora phaseoli]GIJ77680.1 polysaccharide pyruvyl transferase [Micromonospora phaseoli]SEI65736.1 Polysaccharide pyruvyl transferase [Micromonospora phaseoli]